MAGAVDLGMIRGMPEDISKRMQANAELNSGKRCARCRCRIKLGLKFTAYKPTVMNGEPVTAAAETVACDGENGCDYAEHAALHSSVMEQIEFAWLDEDPCPPGQWPDEQAVNATPDESAAAAETLAEERKPEKAPSPLDAMRKRAEETS